MRTSICESGVSQCLHQYECHSAFVSECQWECHDAYINVNVSVSLTMLMSI